MSLRTRLVSRLLVYSGAAALAQRRRQAQAAAGQPRLTILAYHRIGEHRPGPAGEDGELFSASPAGFAWQMDYLQRHYAVLSLDEALQRLQAGQPPARSAAVVTFDDGYRDNHSLAAPVLRRLGLPAVIFLTTGFMDGELDLWWDDLAGMLATATISQVQVSGLGCLPVDTPAARRSTQRRLRDWLKSLPDARRREALDDLRRQLGAALSAVQDRPQPMTWDEAAGLQGQGVVFGAHTRTHPILTRLSLEQAEVEIMESRRRIEARLGHEVNLFAYPNGQPGDFNRQTRDLLARLGFRAAVTLVHGSNLLPGPQTVASACADPLELRRVYIGAGDDRAVFIAKLSGVLEMLAQAAGRDRSGRNIPAGERIGTG